MSKISYIKLQILSGMANPSPPIGPALGQKGINIMEFCKSFNKKTFHLEKGMPIPVIITVFQDRSFSYIIKSPPSSFLIKKYLLIKKGSDKPGTKIIGYIKEDILVKIANIKLLDMNSNNINSIIKCLIGTACSMGVKIESN